MKPVILVSADDTTFFGLLDYVLRAEGFETLSANGLDQTLRTAVQRTPDMVLIDCRSQSGSCVEFCTRLSRKTDAGRITVIALTDAGDETAESRLLDVGVDACIAGPVLPTDLVRRLRQLVGRSGAGSDRDLLRYADIEMNLTTHRVSRDGRRVDLGPTEFRLLRRLMEQPGKVFSRDELVAGAWQRKVHLGSRTVDVHMGRLRKALNCRSKTDIIRTVRSVGYALSDEVDDRRT